MSFLKSAINQVGRDFGKVISNQIFKDAHSTPIRMAGGNASSNPTNKRPSKTSVEKSLEFPLTFKVETLVNKLIAAHIEVKNEVQLLIADNQLSKEELNKALNLLNAFNNKAGDIADIIEFDFEKNSEEATKLKKVCIVNIEMFIEAIQVGINGAKQNLQNLDNYLQKEKSGLSGLFSNSKIKENNKRVEILKINNSNYIKALESIITQLNAKVFD